MKSPKFNKSQIQISGTMGIRIPTDNGIKEIDFTFPTISNGKSGVYEIRNKFNGKRYIGMSNNLYRRMNRHWNDLGNGKHHASPEMYQDLLFYAIFSKNKEIDDVFEFNVILYCRPSELTFWENILINNVHPEYNVHKQKGVCNGTN